MIPLKTLRIVEFEGLGTGPQAGRLLADLGAEVTVIARPEAGEVARRLGGPSRQGLLHDGKQMLYLDLKQAGESARALDLVGRADALIEGYRPGVMERLGLGPQVCLAANPRLVYGRMTGWGQDGPLAQTPGHDLNYLALSGLLSLSHRPGEKPMVTPTVLGDAGGALGLAFGLVSGVLSARSTGRGCVVDAAIVDIAAALGGLLHWIRMAGQIDSGGPSPFHDSPFYDCYKCADGRFVAVAALEPPFYAELLQRLGFEDVDPAAQYDTEQWPALKERMTARFLSRSRDEWCTSLEGTSTCFAPVLDLPEAARHPQLRSRGTLRQTPEGGFRSAPAPRFSSP